MILRTVSLLVLNLLLALFLALSARAEAAQTGMASFYHPGLEGRSMANGAPYRSARATVASRTLPLGSRVVVTNLKNHRRAHATVEDRGPYARGRILDVSGSLARRLGMVRAGVARVRVALLP